MVVSRAGGDPGPTPDPPGVEALEAAVRAALARLPRRLQEPVRWALARWPGRVLLKAAASCVRIEIFDRSMTIAAQFFTSVFPILILMASWLGAAESRNLADAVDLPEQSRSVLDEAVQSSASYRYGVIGLLVVLVSATSLSRALTRAFAAIWSLPRPKSNLRSAWRWLTVVVALALSLVVVRALAAFAAEVPPGDVWERVVAFTADVAIMLLVPWLLLAGKVPLARLLPGALLFAGVMLVLRPASSAWLPRALEAGAERYGSIGVAFTYLAWLYVLAFGVLLTSVVGQVVATDRGRLGVLIRGERPLRRPGRQGGVRSPAAGPPSSRRRGPSGPR